MFSETQIRQKFPEFFGEGSPLDPGYHAALLLRVDSFCRQAGVPAKYLCSPRDPRITEAEDFWLTNYYKNIDKGLFGIAYVAVPDAFVRMQMIAAALLRNYEDAKVRVAEDIVAAQRNGGVSATVLCIPDFCISSSPPSAHAVNVLRSVVLARFSAGEHTLIAVDDLGFVKKVYGNMLFDLISNGFLGVTS